MWDDDNVEPFDEQTFFGILSHHLRAASPQAVVRRCGSHGRTVSPLVPEKLLLDHAKDPNAISSGEANHRRGFLSPKGDKNSPLTASVASTTSDALTPIHGLLTPPRAVAERSTITASRSTTVIGISQYAIGSPLLTRCATLAPTASSCSVPVGAVTASPVLPRAADREEESAPLPRRRPIALVIDDFEQWWDVMLGAVTALDVAMRLFQCNATEPAGNEEAGLSAGRGLHHRLHVTAAQGAHSAMLAIGLRRRLPAQRVAERVKDLAVAGFARGPPPPASVPSPTSGTNGSGGWCWWDDRAEDGSGAHRGGPWSPLRGDGNGSHSPSSSRLRQCGAFLCLPKVVSVSLPAGGRVREPPSVPEKEFSDALLCRLIAGVVNDGIEGPAAVAIAQGGVVRSLSFWSRCVTAFHELAHGGALHTSPCACGGSSWCLGDGDDDAAVAAAPPLYVWIRRFRARDAMPLPTAHSAIVSPDGTPHPTAAGRRSSGLVPSDSDVLQVAITVPASRTESMVTPLPPMSGADLSMCLGSLMVDLVTQLDALH